MKEKIWNIPNPRIESEDHFYQPDMKHLPSLGFKPTYSLENELRITIPKLLEYKSRIVEKQSYITPKIRWAA